MAKAVLAIVDVLLLQKSMYHASYRERVIRIANLYPFKKELIELSNWAITEKMNPSAPAMKPKDTFNLYTQVLGLYHKEMYTVLSKFYSKKIITTDDLRKAKLNSLNELIQRLKVFIRYRTLKPYYRRLNILFAQAYYVESIIADDKYKRESIEQCKALVNKLNSNMNSNNISLNALKKQIVELSR